MCRQPKAVEWGIIMSVAKTTIIDKLNKISDDLEEMEIIERLYMLSRLEHSKKRCKEEGTMTQKSGKHKAQYTLEWSPDAIEDLDAVGIAAGELRQQAKMFRKNPEKGTVIPEIGSEDFREFIYRKCNIVYEIRETAILVHEIYNRSGVFNRSFAL